MFSAFIPTRGFALIRRIVLTEEKTSGGIIMPGSTNQEKGSIGTIEELGDPELLSNGKETPQQLAKGMTVFFGKYSGTEATKDWVVLRHSEILGIVHLYD